MLEYLNCRELPTIPADNQGVMSKLKHPFSLFVPVPDPNMSLQNSIYLPKYYSDKNRTEVLKDSGVVPAVGPSIIFGARVPIGELILILRTFQQRKLISLLSRLACHLSHTGIKSIERDERQLDLVRAAIRAGSARGLFPSEEFKRERMSDIFFLSPNLITGCMALCLVESPTDESGVDPLSDFESFAFLLLGLNDHVFDESGTEEEGKNHYRFLRQNLVQAPLLGTYGTFSQRICRFHRVFTETLARMNPDLRKLADTYIEKRIGVDFKTLNSLLFAINVPWILNKEKNTNVIIDENFARGNRISDEVKKVLKRLSLTQVDFALRVQALKVSGESYYKSSPILALFTQYPFIEIQSGSHLLLAPHLILRTIELSVRSAFIDAKHKPIEDIYGPLGEEFERYSSQLLARKLSAAAGNLIATGLEHNPADDEKNEITDSIIESPDGSIIIESKYRPPAIAALNIADARTTEIEKWVSHSFTLIPSEGKKQNRRPGALWQLREAALKLNLGARGFLPRNIVPVIVISEEVLFTQNLYFILDREIQEKRIFDGIGNIRPFLIISIGELELLTSMELGGTKWTLFKIFLEKSSNAGARQMNWVKFIQMLSLKYSRPADETATFDLLFEEAKAYFAVDSKQPQ